ncbi:MAG TPA: glycosyltransferase family 39 protein [Ktedonobacterales bacterium]|nr:glycosyltransferase family 39 protein [Ktedonobacterales bacterium]
MDTTIDISLQTAEEEAQPLAQPNDFSARFWTWLGLGAVMIVSIFMNFYQLGQNGFGNLYYAAGVRSMADSLHNFFFVSFDPGGFVTIDKPPLGFWLQVASVKVFGFTPFAIFLPQALAGVLSVLLLYHLVRRHFGVIAGLLAALTLAISPISVVTNRNNTIDSTLVLALLLGAWAVMRAAETGKLRWLLLCAVFVGLGFNIKMLEAYLVVPAFGLLYLLASPRRLRVRLAHLMIAGLLMALISFSWAATVDAISASQRPYVGSSQNNSEISLALGYNGLERLEGMGAGTGGAGAPGIGRGDFQPPEGGPFGGNGGNGPPEGIFGGNGGNGAPGGGSGGPGGGTSTAGQFNTGLPGMLRLFTEPLGGQIAWLLPLAILAVLALAWQRRKPVSESDISLAFIDGEPIVSTPLGRLRQVGEKVFSRFRDDRQQQSLVLWGMWLLTTGVFFSLAGFFHQYYLSTMAPAIAALFGIGLVMMWKDYRHSGWRGWLLPLALVATAIEQIYLIETDPTWGVWLIPLIAIPCIAAAVVLFAARLLMYLRPADLRFTAIRFNQRVLATTLCVALAALLLTPAVWSAIPGLNNVVQDLPIAGASQQGAGGGTALNIDTALISYLEAHQGSAKYLVAVSSAQEASSIILATNKPVMALGGFTGSDPILTTSELAKLAADGVVRYFLVGGGGGPGGGQSSLTSWITSHCTLVSSSQAGASNLYYYSGT